MMPVATAPRSTAAMTPSSSSKIVALSDLNGALHLVGAFFHAQPRPVVIVDDAGRDRAPIDRGDDPFVIVEDRGVVRSEWRSASCRRLFPCAAAPSSNC